MNAIKKQLLNSLADADRKLFGTADEPDVTLRERSVIGLMHQSSPQLLPGGPFSAPLGTVPGDFLARRADGTQTVYEGATRFMAQVIGVRYHSAEYEPDTGSERGRFVCDHPGETPQQLGARFLRADRDGVAKSGWCLGANRLIPTYDILFLVDGHGYVMAFYKTAEMTGEEIARRASRFQVKIGNDTIKSPVVAKIQIISVLEKGKSGRKYFVPKIGRIVKLGESDDITLDEARKGKVLRDAFKVGGEWMPEEPPEPPPSSSSTSAVIEPPVWDEAPPHNNDDIIDIDPDDEYPL
jgi:hypothetical protein